MTLDDELDVMHDIPFFDGVAPINLKRLAFASDRLIFKAGQQLFCEDEEANTAYVILAGNAEIHQKTDEGAVKIGEVHSRSIVGEVALLHDRSRTNTVTAIGTMETLLISKDSFQKLIASCPHTMLKILNSLGEQMSKAR